MSIPHRVSDRLIKIHLPAFSPGDELCTVHTRIIIVVPCYARSTQCRVASGAEDGGGGDGRQSSPCGWRFRDCGIEPAAAGNLNLFGLTMSTAKRKRN